MSDTRPASPDKDPHPMTVITTITVADDPDTTAAVTAAHYAIAQQLGCRECVVLQDGRVTDEVASPEDETR